MCFALSLISALPGGLLASSAWSSGWKHRPWQRAWNWKTFQFPSKPRHSMTMHGQPHGEASELEKWGRKDRSVYLHEVVLKSCPVLRRCWELCEHLGSFIRAIKELLISARHCRWSFCLTLECNISSSLHRSPMDLGGKTALCSWDKALYPQLCGT